MYSSVVLFLNKWFHLNLKNRVGSNYGEYLEKNIFIFIFIFSYMYNLVLLTDIKFLYVISKILHGVKLKSVCSMYIDVY